MCSLLDAVYGSDEEGLTPLDLSRYKRSVIDG